jgi:AraC family transcriptional regulator
MEHSSPARYHLFPMGEPPKLSRKYCYSLYEEDLAWTQQHDWLLLLLTQPGLVTIGARTFAHGAHTAFLVPPSSRCRLRTSGTNDPSAFWMLFQPETTGSPVVAVPQIQPLGEDGPFWERRLRMGLNRGFAMAPEMQVAFADLLWCLAVDPGSIRQSPILEAAEKYVEEHLAGSLRVEALAEAVEVSHNHLIRLFKEEHGVTPIEYIRLRKQHHACRLLMETTLPIKQVAAAVGMSDLAQFNHLVHGAAGMSPRELRATRTPPDIFRVGQD